MEILCIDDSEEYRIEASYRGFRLDVHVKIDDSIYNVSCYDFVRLSQDAEGEIDTIGVFNVDPNLIIVKEVAASEIIRTINYLYKGGYFTRIKPLSQEEAKEIESELVPLE